MRDVGDYWREHREYKRNEEAMQIKERKTSEALVAIRKNEKIKVLAVFNDGYHYLLEIKTDFGLAMVDFYPTTQVWRRRKSNANGRSTKGMFAYFKIGSEK